MPEGGGQPQSGQQRDGEPCNGVSLRIGPPTPAEHLPGQPVRAAGCHQAQGGRVQTQGQAGGTKEPEKRLHQVGHQWLLAAADGPPQAINAVGHVESGNALAPLVEVEPRRHLVEQGVTEQGRHGQHHNQADPRGLPPPSHMVYHDALATRSHAASVTVWVQFSHDREEQARRLRSQTQVTGVRASVKRGCCRLA